MSAVDTVRRESIPTEEEYRAATDALSQGIGDVELLGMRLKTIAKQWEDAPREDEVAPQPTLADLGALWTLIDDAGDQVKHLAAEIATLKEVMVSMDEARRAAALRELAA